MNRVSFAILTVLGLIAGASLARADNYSVDPMHTAAVFKISHLELSWTFGRFNTSTATSCSTRLTRRGILSRWFIKTGER